MMDHTDRHCRYFLRTLSRKALLYTPMLTAAAVVHGDRQRLLEFAPQEQPVTLQLGGSDPRQMAEAAAVGEHFGYSGININVGCPSDRVRDGQFGACLMATPKKVAECVASMRQAVSLPISVKCRIGIDHNDSYEALCRFVESIAASGCTTFIVHARKAWLHGLSPKQNREVPPLRYPVVYQLKRDFPSLEIIVNGGISTLAQCSEHLTQVDGVMLGRAVLNDPWLLHALDRDLFGCEAPHQSREDVVKAMAQYANEWCLRGLGLHRVTRHMMGLFHGEPGARTWRRTLSEQAVRPGADGRVLLRALGYVHEQANLPRQQALA